MYKCINNLAPSYLCNLFAPRTPNCYFRNAKTKLMLPKPRTDYLKRSFSYSGAFLWKDLPEEIRTSNSLCFFKVAEHSFGSLWVYVICQIIAKERSSSQAENWQVKNILMKHFNWQVKFGVFAVSMATWMIEYNLKISLLFSLHKIRSLDFPVNLHSAYCN